MTLDIYPAVGPPRGATILSYGFTRSRRTLSGHAQALADAGVLALTPDLPCTFDFRCNARALAALVGLVRGERAAPQERRDHGLLAAPTKVGEPVRNWCYGRWLRTC